MAGFLLLLVNLACQLHTAPSMYKKGEVLKSERLEAEERLRKCRVVLGMGMMERGMNAGGIFGFCRFLGFCSRLYKSSLERVFSF